MANDARMPDNDPVRGNEDEWNETPAEIERRPSGSGSQVVSARLPTALVAELNRRADEQGIKLSEVLRTAVEYYLRREGEKAPLTLSMSYGLHLRAITPGWPLGTENRVVAEQPEPLTYVPALSSDHSQ